eukprot:TRINITY_DN1619_c1_g1_i5.p1 TRINITY_DN1619_c1_g1~~TRINITY_DN1619_c1_g1_i5.p1  ORF type:complete len:537 (+),score=213.18 TRINITY_DN1619_c1_g1_i5:59-1612(+)
MQQVEIKYPAQAWQVLSRPDILLKYLTLIQRKRLMGIDLGTHWATVADTLHDGLLVVDDSGCIMAVNPAGEELTGYKKEDLVGQNCRVLNCTGCKVINKGRGEDYCGLFRQGSVASKRCTITNAAGQPVDVLKRASVLKDDQGRAIGAVETLIDVSELARKEQEITDLRRTLRGQEDGRYGLLGRSGAMQRLFDLIENVASSEAPVLIQGESGTGKELVARAIHHQSPRRESPLVTVNCGAIPSELLESELFGHEKGAFTGAVRTRVGRFELAQGGTIFLDEIGDMPPLLQVKILRVLQEHAFERVGGTRTIEVDLRVLAATNQDLASRVEAGEFREDLYYRLNVVPIEVPPLRERKSDIPLLCDFFLERLARLKGLELKELSPEVRERFLRYSWPGNVRELENLLERLVVLAEGEMIGPEALPAKLDGEELLPDLEGDGELPAVVLPPGGLNLKSSLDQLERRLIAQALEQSGGVKAQAAALLGLNRTTLVQKLKKMGNLRYRSNHKDSDKQQEHP